MRAGTAALRAGPARAGEWRVLHTQLQVTSLPMAFPSMMLKFTAHGFSIEDA